MADIPNPPPDHSSLPSSIAQFAVSIDVKKSNALTHEQLEAVQEFRRAASYIAAAMIFLKDNILLEREITADDIKPRLLGHWGTCPGLILVYAHLNLLIQKHNLNVLHVVGPGHGAPANLACLWLENSLGHFISDYSRNKQGLTKLISKFSAPGGFPSHINAEVPGSIHEGGELGYALAVSYGAVMDNPDLIVACVVGDGEAESGPTATAWHAHKYIDPAESGAVLPILHANGFKISERTITGCMDDLEVISLFTGYGYQVRIVEDLENIDLDLAASFDWAIGEIKKIQHAARSGKPIVKPRWPMIVMRTPKGWSCPKKIHGEIIEGSYHSHQVPLPKAKSDKEELAALNTWLASYKPHELFDSKTAQPNHKVLSIIPKHDEQKIGQAKASYASYFPLDMPDWKSLAAEKGTQVPATHIVGELLKEVIKKNPKYFRIFSPDELVSNKLDAVFDITTRNFQGDPETRAKGGRVIEMLSEHTLQGMMQGYTLTGRVGLFPSYEAFLGIVATMMVQYHKFAKMSLETSWRTHVGSLNYLETSTWTRQEHNGFSHQNPGFIGSVLALKPKIARVYLPPDANCFLSTVSHCLRAKNYINLIVASKNPSPVWLSKEEADSHCTAGASIWKFASTDGGLNPDVVLVGIGMEVNFEVIAAAALLRKLLPKLRVRVINVTDLMILGPIGSHPHSLNDEAFDALFTKDKPIHFNYHGYPIELKGLIFGRNGLEGRKVTVAGYMEEGSTTTPFDMLSQNQVSRFHVAIAAVEAAIAVNPEVAIAAHEVTTNLQHSITKQTDFILANGKDPDDMFDIPKFD